MIKPLRRKARGFLFFFFLNYFFPLRQKVAKSASDAHSNLKNYAALSHSCAELALGFASLLFHTAFLPRCQLVFLNSRSESHYLDWFLDFNRVKNKMSRPWQLRFVRCEIAQRVAERRATQKNRRVRCLGNECNSIATRFF